MTKNNYWVRSGAYVFLQRIAIFIFGFGSYFFLVRYFSKEVFGIWALFVVITSVVEMSRAAFIQNAFVKFYSQEDIEKADLFKASMFLNLVSNIFFIAILVLFIPLLTRFWHSSEIGYLIFWYCITSSVLVFLTQINYIEQASGNFKGIFWSSVARQGLFFLITLFCFLFIPGLPLWFFAAMQTVSSFFGLLVASRLYKATGKVGFLFKLSTLNWDVVRRLFRFGKYVLGTGVMSSIGKSADQIILGSVSHSIEAIYNATMRIMNFIEIPTYSISNVVYPKIAEKASKEGKIAAGLMYEKSVSYIVAIIAPAIIGIIIFPEFILLITSGKNYTEAAGILQLIAMAAILFPFNVQVGTAFEVIGKPQISFMINLGSNILNVILNITLIYTIGLMGAVWTVIISAVASFIVSQILLSREMGVSFIRIIVHIPQAYSTIFSEVLRKIKERYGS